MISSFAEIGVSAAAADARRIVRTGDGVGVDGNCGISLVYNKLDQVKLINDSDAVAYLDAAADGDICFVNSLMAQCVLNDKGILALLSDPHFEAAFTPEQRRVIDAHVPWTRILSDQPTTLPDGASGMAAEYAVQHRVDLVLKPRTGTRGRGVVIGVETPQDAWERAVSGVASARTHLLQSYLPLPNILVPRGGKMHHMCYDLDTFVFQGQFAGFMSRASTESIVNVGRNGVLLPVVVGPQGHVRNG